MGRRVNPDAAAWPAAGPLGYLEDGFATLQRAQSGQGNRGGAPGHSCGVGTKECAQHGSRHNEGDLEHLRAA